MTHLDQLSCCLTRSHVYIQMHNYPDQDAIASAFGLMLLLKEKGIAATICYHGIIDKDNTLKMIKLLSIPLARVEQLCFIKEDEIIVVDGQKGNINVHDILGREIACIDHHTKMNTNCYRYHDIRPGTGSCSSIIASYFYESKIPIPKEAATALLYGLKMDTAQMTRSVSPLDLDIFYTLYPLADQVILKTLEHNSLKLSDLKSYHDAIANLVVVENLAIADIGTNCPEAVIGSVNDFLLTINDIDFTLLYCRRAGGIKFSIRNAIPFLDASDIIRAALKDLGDGGGHNEMAAGFIPNVTVESEVHRITNEVIKRIILLVTEPK